jgi:MFS transporter, PAT family, beta-lactamase induction signal transducer AmpG
MCFDNRASRQLPAQTCFPIRLFLLYNNQHQSLSSPWACFLAFDEVNSMPQARRLPPTWLMGLTNAPFGLTGGFCAVIIPQLLAAHGIPAGHIATITAAILSPGFWIFAFSPMLDAWLSRRTYALIFGSLTAVAVAFTVAHTGSPGLVEAVMIAGFAAAMLYQGAVGGWMGSLIEKREDSRLGIWFAVSNLGAGGLMMVLAGELTSRLTPTQVGILMGAVILLPMLLFLAIPSPPPKRCPARESFGRFNRELASLLKQRSVLMALALFLLPAASFALTNVLGGTGSDFSTSERTVSLFAGVGSTAAGILGSFLLFPLARRFPLRPVYLAIGITGAIFTLSLLTLPRAPWTFGIAITGENLFQALAFAAGNAITFEVIGPDNPFAATLFTLLLAATNLPITYMQFIDGRGYDWHGLTGAFLTDAAVSIAACLLLGWMLTRWRLTSQAVAQPLAPLPENAD